MPMIANISGANYYCPTDDEDLAIDMLMENLELEGEVEVDEDGDWSIGGVPVELIYLDEFMQI